jgi:hypothetical protein
MQLAIVKEKLRRDVIDQKPFSVPARTDEYLQKGGLA